MQKITKAVIPAAGLGTRFLPATKACPKEMLPIVDKPTIQYIIEEALASGITDILIVSGRTKRAIEDHFDRSPELEMNLEEHGKLDLLRAAVKMVLYGTLSATTNNQNIGNTASQCLFNNILNGGLIHNGQHFLGAGLGSRQKTCAQASGRNNCFGNLLHNPSSILR